MVAVANANVSLAELLGRADTSIAQVAAHLDGLEPEERARQLQGLAGKKLQRRLWELAADSPPLTMGEMLPAGKSESRWVGRNSMPMFTGVDKRMVRQGSDVIGYNHEPVSAIGRWFSGPGYFTMLPAPGRPKELVVDYTREPSTAPAGWPALASNTSGTHTLVYGHLNDFCRRVSDGVFIGGAERKGKFLDIYFTVARL
jgi:hypothetical protein